MDHKQKTPKNSGPWNILLQISNDITNPVKRLYATTNFYFAVSFYCKYVNRIRNQQKNLFSSLKKNILCKRQTCCLCKR